MVSSTSSCMLVVLFLLRVPLETRDRVAHRERKVPWELEAIRERLEREETLETLARSDQEVYLDPLGLRDSG